jgi:hypothetical protein
MPPFLLPLLLAQVPELEPEPVLEPEPIPEFETVPTQNCHWFPLLNRLIPRMKTP